MNTDIEEAEKPYIEVELDEQLAKKVAHAMQQVAGVAKLYKEYGGPFKPLTANTKISGPPVKRKPRARTIKRTLKFMR